MNLAHNIFGEHEQNYWDQWIQRVPGLWDNLINIKRKNGLFG